MKRPSQMDGVRRWQLLGKTDHELLYLDPSKFWRFRCWFLLHSAIRAVQLGEYRPRLAIELPGAAGIQNLPILDVTAPGQHHWPGHDDTPEEFDDERIRNEHIAITYSKFDGPGEDSVDDEGDAMTWWCQKKNIYTLAKIHRMTRTRKLMAPRRRRKTKTATLRKSKRNKSCPLRRGTRPGDLDDTTACRSLIRNKHPTLVASITDLDWLSGHGST